jgi:hypothetical protein
MRVFDLQRLQGVANSARPNGSGETRGTLAYERLVSGRTKRFVENYVRPE